MQIHLIAVGDRMPDWVRMGYNEYTKRLPKECSLVLHEISLSKRHKNAPSCVEEEGKRILSTLSHDDYVVALEVEGCAWTTLELSRYLSKWMQTGQRIALLIGGPDGLAEACRKRAHQEWSLSPLTLPHPLVRVVIAEQIYRAWSILKNHPYHRS